MMRNNENQFRNLITHFSKCDFIKFIDTILILDDSKLHWKFTFDTTNHYDTLDIFLIVKNIKDLIRNQYWT